LGENDEEEAFGNNLIEDLVGDFIGDFDLFSFNIIASGNLKVNVSLVNLFHIMPNTGFELLDVSIDAMVTFPLFNLDEIRRSSCTTKNLLLFIP
jgi:hypothetical protein